MPREFDGCSTSAGSRLRPSDGASVKIEALFARQYAKFLNYPRMLSRFAEAGSDFIVTGLREIGPSRGIVRMWRH